MTLGDNALDSVTCFVFVLFFDFIIGCADFELKVPFACSKFTHHFRTSHDKLGVPYSTEENNGSRLRFDMVCISFFRV